MLMERCWSEAPSERPKFGQVVKVLKMLEDKQVYQWTPPDNYSLDEETQHRHILSWQMERESKNLAMAAAEQKLMQAKQQLKTAKMSQGDAIARPHE